MILRVGPFLYRVHFQDAPLIHEGERCLGLCDNEMHEIYIAAQTSFAQQVQVICHEYMEAWLYHFGHATRDGHAHAHERKEAYCDLFGMAMAQFVMDLIRQLDQLSDAMPTQAPAEARHDQSATDASAHDAQQTSRERIATKLAHAAARAGLKVRHMNATTTPPHQPGQKGKP